MIHLRDVSVIHGVWHLIEGVNVDWAPHRHFTERAVGSSRVYLVDQEGIADSVD
jgi:hypothetical protein